jgi:uncharacterized protein (DUF1684 family)
MRLLKVTLAVALMLVPAACLQPDKPAPAATVAPATGTSVPAAAAAGASGDPYRAEILKFQQEREAALRAENGWLTVAGLFFLTQPVTSFGSDPLNDIVLPESAPGRAGTFELRNGKVSVKAAEGVSFQLDGKITTTAELKPDGQGPPDRIALGDLTLWVHNSGQRLSIRLRDKNSTLRKAFTGTSWFPINPAYRVEGRYTAYDKPRIAQIPNILGDLDTLPIPGTVTFTINGQAMTLESVAEPGDEELWFIFRDLTSLNDTYPAARFLYTPRPVSGKVILDFNKAENPPCAYSPYTTCPLPSEQNRLRTRIEAGEKLYKGRSD